MTVFTCKTCGRSIRCEEKPNFCYADRTTSIENISDEDAVKMQLFRSGGYVVMNFGNGECAIEFPGDIKYHPFNGEKSFGAGFTLSEYQDEIMSRVRA